MTLCLEQSEQQSVDLKSSDKSHLEVMLLIVFHSQLENVLLAFSAATKAIMQGPVELKSVILTGEVITTIVTHNGGYVVEFVYVVFACQPLSARC